jgi:hypothetical protein
MRIKKFKVDTPDEEVNAWMSYVNVVSVEVTTKYIVIVYKKKPPTHPYIRDEEK